MKTLFAALVSGALFGLGLIISGMSNPARVLNFLDWSSNWDPTLAFVMGGAVAVALPGFHWVRQRSKPLFGNSFDMPTSTSIDKKLIAGASIFGIGWGIGGFCPGPSLVALTTLHTDVLLFVAAMLVGMVLHHWLVQRGRI